MYVKKSNDNLYNFLTFESFLVFLNALINFLDEKKDQKTMIVLVDFYDYEHLNWIFVMI